MISIFDFIFEYNFLYKSFNGIVINCKKTNIDKYHPAYEILLKFFGNHASNKNIFATKYSI